MSTKTIEPVQLTKHEQNFLFLERGSKAKGDFINIDTPMSKCQRPLYSNDIKRYIKKHEGVNWDLFGQVKAVRDPNTGELAVIDGQHRMAVVKTILPNCKEIPAHVVDVDEITSFKYFGELNGGSTRNVSAEEKFFVRVLSGDQESLKIRDLLVQCNLACGEVNKDNAFASVKFPNFKKCYEMSPAAIVIAANLWKEAMQQPLTDSTKPLDYWNDNIFAGLVRMISLEVAEIRDADNKKIYSSIDHTKELMDPSSKVYDAFRRWWLNWVPNQTQKSMTYTALRSGLADWSYGVALGLTMDFCKWTLDRDIRRNNVKVKQFRAFFNYLIDARKDPEMEDID